MTYQNNNVARPLAPLLTRIAGLIVLILTVLACGEPTDNGLTDEVVAPTAPPFTGGGGGGGGGGDTIPTPTSAALAGADNPLPTAPPVGVTSTPEVLPATWTPVPTATGVPPTATPPPAPTAPPPAPAPASGEVPSVGADVIVDEVRWRVLAAQSLGQTLVGDADWVETLQSEGQFVSVSFEVENLDNDPRTFWDPRLMDSLGRTYDVVPNRWAYLGDNEDCILEQLNPNVAQTCTLVYELSSDAVGVQLVATPLDWFDPETRTINIGLTP